MAYAARPIDFHRSKSQAWRGLLCRLFDAVIESRARAVEREAEVYLARTGGRFTDSIEREINDRHFNGGWNLCR